MARIAIAILLFLFAALAPHRGVLAGTIAGEVIYNGSTNNASAITVQLWRLPTEPDGTLMPLQKRAVLGADGQLPFAQQHTTLPPASSAHYSYTFTGVPPGNYTTLAFAASRLRAGSPLGWATMANGCFGDDEGADVCTQVLVVGDNNTAATVNANAITLRAPTPFAAGNRTAPNGYGAFARARGGRAVLRLGPGGAPYDRGVAHGHLVARQVMDMLAFFLLEDRVRHMGAYEGVVRARLVQQSLFATPQDVLDEARGIVDGVAAAGVPLRLDALGRDADKWDIVALNAYGELTVLDGIPGAVAGAGGDENSGRGHRRRRRRRSKGPQCTQMVWWGARTAGSDVDGGTIAGRNMDGEIDLRKVTVSHLLIFAVDAGAPARRYVSVMWPGYIGSYSGFNEAGTYMMANAGCGGPPSTYPPDGRYPIDTIVLRDFLASPALPDGGAVTPAAAARQIAALPGNATTKTGGVLPAGNILVVAQPYTVPGAGAAGDTPVDGGFIFEGDRDGGVVRLAYPETEHLPTEAAAAAAAAAAADADAAGSAVNYLWRTPPEMIMTTNHWHLYKSDVWEGGGGPGAGVYWARGGGAMTCPSAEAETGVGYNTDGAVSFSSLWRYKAGMGFAAARARGGRPVGTAAVHEALRHVAEGETEHSIVWRANARTFDIAVAALDGALWDAPYEPWTTFAFDEVFLMP